MGVDQETIQKVMAELGSRGGNARAKSLTAKERQKIAVKASKAAAAARTKKAKQKKASAQK
jgi:hypothetical protein